MVLRDTKVQTGHCALTVGCCVMSFKHECVHFSSNFEVTQPDIVFILRENNRMYYTIIPTENNNNNHNIIVLLFYNNLRDRLPWLQAEYQGSPDISVSFHSEYLHFFSSVESVMILLWHHSCLYLAMTSFIRCWSYVLYSLTFFSSRTALLFLMTSMENSWTILQALRYFQKSGVIM